MENNHNLSVKKVVLVSDLETEINTHAFHNIIKEHQIKKAWAVVKLGDHEEVVAINHLFVKTRREEHKTHISDKEVNLLLD